MQTTPRLKPCKIGGSSWLDANDAVLNGAGGEVPQFFGATGLQHPGIEQTCFGLAQVTFPTLCGY